VVEALRCGPIKPDEAEAVNRRSRDVGVLTVTVSAVVVAMRGSKSVSSDIFVFLLVAFLLFLLSLVVSDEPRKYYLHVLSVISYSIGILLLLLAIVLFISGFSLGHWSGIVKAVGVLAGVIVVLDMRTTIQTTISFVLEYTRQNE